MADDDNYPNTSAPAADQDSFEVSDFLELGDYFVEENQENPALMTCSIPMLDPIYSSNEIIVGSSSFQGDSGMTGKEKKEIREKVAFKTKSEVEVLDDGFKWRKYGKKMVKNSPNPRNYYRCSVEGCPVKKRVERDKEDPRYVVTTYEGIHNHLQQGTSAHHL